jgi:hypothetical protein
VEEERDYFGEQLKEMENEVISERNQREELTNRLQQLQQKVPLVFFHFLSQSFPTTLISLWA